MKIIAETAWHHDGDIHFFKELVKSISTKTEADYVKFHITLNLDEYMHSDYPAYGWAKERIFLKKQWIEIFKIAIDNGKKLMLLFNDKEAIDFGMKHNPELVEIHSVCLNDIKLLNHLSLKINHNTQVVLGVGGSDLYEIENAIGLIDSRNFILMHGFQNYPTKYEDINFNKIRKIIGLFPEFKHGYADHTAWDNKNNTIITLMGAALGIDYVEKHVSIVTGEGRPDWQSAVSINKFIEVQENLKILSRANGDGLLKLNDGEKTYSTFGPMKKAAILNKDVKKGEKLELNTFEFKRTVQNSDLSQLKIIEYIGHKFSRRLSKGHCIINSDIVE